MGLKYRITDQHEWYFVTFTVVDWIDVFVRERYKEIFIDSVKYCQRNKGLLVGAWVIMSSHVHMIISCSGDHKLSDVIRDLKSFTSRHIRLAIDEEGESRREWMMHIFQRHGHANSNNHDFQFWIQDNHPILVTSDRLRQRLEYIHNNPVVAGFVTEPWHWKHSSAHDYCGGKQGIIELMMLA